MNYEINEKLNNWACKEEKICPQNFDCKYYSSCSNGAKLDRGKTSVMSYIGRKYDLANEFRIAIVGIDHGTTDSNTFDQRRSIIEDCYQNNKDGHFNPHYKGVAKTAAAFFGKAGDFCKSNCHVSCQKSANKNAACVLDRITQPNLVKCVPEGVRSMTSVTSHTMKENCSHNLVSELKIMNPNLVIFHGKSSRDIMVRTMKDMELSLDAVGDTPAIREVLFNCEDLGIHLLFLSHPSHNWLEREWDSLVEPCMSYMREQNIIPE